MLMSTVLETLMIAWFVWKPRETDVIGILSSVSAVGRSLCSQLDRHSVDIEFRITMLYSELEH